MNIIDPSDFMADNLANLSTMARFAEDVAHVLSTSTTGTLSPDGWAGFSMVIGMVREGLDELAAQSQPE